MAVGGHVRDAGLVHLPRPGRRDVSAGELDLSGGRVAEADHRLDQLVLAVARDARDAEDLAARISRSTPRTAGLPRSS